MLSKVPGLILELGWRRITAGISSSPKTMNIDEVFLRSVLSKTVVRPSFGTISEHIFIHRLGLNNDFFRVGDFFLTWK
jgi:hypothetical protein